MAWFRSRTQRRIRSDGRRLAEESEAFLRGEYILEIPAGSPVPPGVWINVLAHGSESMLRRIADRYDGAPPVRAAGWVAARGYVAAALIARVDGEVIDLAEFQRSVLIPLELAALSGVPASMQSPRDLVAIILASLPERRPNGPR